MSRQWSSAVYLRYPSCGVRELARFRRVSEATVAGEHYAGELEHLVMRTVTGEEWRPFGRIQFDAVRVRESLDEEGRAMFDAWQTSESAPMAPRPRSRARRDFRANAQQTPLQT